MDSSPLVSVNILTKNRAPLLRAALMSVQQQSFLDYEIVVIDDGSSDGTEELLKDCGLRIANLKVIRHEQSIGITKSRQEALLQSRGEYIAILDDDDEWADKDKLKKQVAYFKDNPKTVLIGGGRYVFDPERFADLKFQDVKLENLPRITRPKTDAAIRSTMLLRNNFFTSTVMFRQQAAMEAGGFVSRGVDLAEDYDLWLRLGRLGEMYNFQEPFDKYRLPEYDKAKFRQFLEKQLQLIGSHKNGYPNYWLGKMILRTRLSIGI